MATRQLGLVYSSAQGSTLLYPPIFNLRRIGRRDGRGDCQLTFGDLSYVEPDVHASGKLLTSRMKSQSDIWKFPIDESPLREHTERHANYASDRTGPDASLGRRSFISPIMRLSRQPLGGERTLGKSPFERDPAVALGVPIWSPAGNWIVFVVSRRQSALLDAIHPDGTDRREVVSRGWWATADGCITRPSGMVRVSRKSPPTVARQSSCRVTAPESQHSEVTRHSTISRNGSRIVSGLWQSWEICTALPENGASLPVASAWRARLACVRPCSSQSSLSPDGRSLAAPLS